MATGRGQALASFRMGLEKVQRANMRNATSRSSCPNEKETQPDTKKKIRRKSRKRLTSVADDATVSLRDPVNPHQNYFERMPPEIVLKILSYVDAASLFCIGLVSKQLHHLANNNAMWYGMFTNESGKVMKWKPKQTDDVAEVVNAVSIQEKPEGYWKRLYFRMMVGYNESKWKNLLKAINPYTGLPRLTEQVFRDLNVTWEITVTEKRGWESTVRESTVRQTHAYFSDSSVTVCWCNGSWPPFHQLSTLQLHGVKRIAFDHPSVNKPGWRSLIVKHDACDIQVRGKVIGSDKLLNLYHLAPGLIIGLWRGNRSVAIVMMNFHFHRLVERSLLGSSICPYTVPENRPPFDHVDPEYGLRGYTVHILLHNTVTHIMSGHFSQLSCEREHIRGGFIQLRAIDRNDLSQHTPLSGKINLPWKTGGLHGIVQNCCMMTLTVLDEAQNPFWCVSAPVTMVLSKLESSSYHYVGESFFMKHQDSEGKVILELVWLAEQEQYFLTSLVIYIATAKINKHFGRRY